MKIREFFNHGKPVFSFEVFPPKRDGDVESLFKTIEELKALQPNFISVTYGAGGSTRQMTHEIAVRMKAMGILPLVHLTCVGHSQAELGQLLDKLAAAGIENILALRGDPPKGQTEFVPAPDGFRYASQLVEFIRKRWDFCIGVAGYPETHVEAKSPEADLEALQRKCAAGADFITTQLFFDNHRYFDYLQKIRSLGIALPVLPGIMPTLDKKSLARFASFGSQVTPTMLQGFEAAGEDAEKAQQFGLQYAVAQCRHLLQNGAPGLHIYAMNKSWAAKKIHEALG